MAVDERPDAPPGDEHPVPSSVVETDELPSKSETAEPAHSGDEHMDDLHNEDSVAPLDQAPLDEVPLDDRSSVETFRISTGSIKPQAKRPTSHATFRTSSTSIKRQSRRPESKLSERPARLAVDIEIEATTVCDTVPAEDTEVVNPQPLVRNSAELNPQEHADIDADEEPQVENRHPEPKTVSPADIVQDDHHSEQLQTLREEEDSSRIESNKDTRPLSAAHSEKEQPLHAQDIPEEDDAASDDPPADLLYSDETIVDDDQSMDTVALDVSERQSVDTEPRSTSEHSGEVDWDGLERTEEQEPRDEGSDESTAFLLARLEQENNALAVDPKAGLSKGIRADLRVRSQSRPPSIHHLKKLVNEPAPASQRYSLLPTPPPMTELEFYAALVADYPRTAQSLPTLLSKKIRSGIPPPLRGVVWVSMAGARDRVLEDEYDRLCGEPSPYENMIGKDIGRSFPGIDLFRDSKGEGQRMLGRVLKCFSLYDEKIGYCQGLGFLVGPLLMHTGEREAFCVLVKLMEHYDLRSCFLPDLSGLHLRIYQFQQLLEQHHPALSAHLTMLQIEPAYVSQWFLSFFAVTCPLPMLLRIYDVIFAEGASETLMRVALSVMRRNEAKILACHEFEDVMQLLLSRGLWDAYKCDADDLVIDFVGLTGIVTHESLQALETRFRDAQTAETTAKFSSLPDLQAAASRFLGRLWAGSAPSTKSLTLSPSLPTPSRSNSPLRRTASKQSITSTINSCEGGTESSLSTVPTEATEISRQSSGDGGFKPGSATASVIVSDTKARSRDRDLHGQIEDLLTALSEMQREQAVLAGELQREREEREEDRKIVTSLTASLKQRLPSTATEEGLNALDGEVSPQDSVKSDSRSSADSVLQEVLLVVQERFSAHGDVRRSSILETKHQLREELRRTKERYTVEASRCQDLDRRLTDQDRELGQMREQLKEARQRVQESHRDRPRKSTVPPLENLSDTSLVQSPESADGRSFSQAGLREFKLTRTGSLRSPITPPLSKRTSSLMAPAMIAADQAARTNEDALLAELVNSKTAEAVAKQEAEELKAKLESLRRMLGMSGNLSTPSESRQPTQEKAPTPDAWSPQSVTSFFGSVKPLPLPAAVSASFSSAVPTPSSATAAPGSNSGGGFWSGWGKRRGSGSPVTESH